MRPSLQSLSYVWLRASDVSAAVGLNPYRRRSELLSTMKNKENYKLIIKKGAEGFEANSKDVSILVEKKGSDEDALRFNIIQISSEKNFNEDRKTEVFNRIEEYKKVNI